MIHLTQLSLKARMILIISVLILSGFIFAFVLSFIQKEAETTQIPQPPIIANHTAPNLNMFTYSGEAFSGPKQASTYKAQSQPLAVYAENFAKTFEAVPTGALNTWENKGTGAYINLNKVLNAVTYRNFPSETFQSSILLPNEDQKYFSDFLSRAKLSHVVPAGPAAYLTGDIHPQKATRSQAVIVIQEFRTTLENLPVFFEGSNKNSVTLWAQGGFGITKADIFPIPANPAKVSQYELVSINSALEKLRNQEGILLAARTTNGTIFSFSDLTSADFNKVSLEYRFAEETGMFTPFYHFTGTAKTRNNASGEIEMTVSAIETR